MKILLLTTHLNAGGIGVYTTGLARHLKREGQTVTVASSGGDLEGVLASDGVPHVKLDIRTKAEFGIKMWRALPDLVKLVRSEKFDIIHAQTRVAQVLSEISGRFTHVPFVTTCHGFFKSKRLSRKLFPCWGKMTIAISDSVREHLLEDFFLSPNSIVRVYNGIELAPYLGVGEDKDLSLMESIGLSREEAVVGSIGRLSSVKGYKYLVEAFREIVSKRAKTRLIIVGDGPEKKALEKDIKRLGLEAQVLLLEKEAPLEKYMGLFDVFCLPSVHEGLGMSIMEAMAAKRACVASNVGGLSELITHEKDGLLVLPESPEAIEKALLRLLGDEVLRKELSDNARKKARSGFSIEDSTRRTIEVYRRVI